jgi:hypothetical protein
MPRLQLAYEVADISALARSLRGGLGKLERMPGHVELLNLLARAAGFRNFQHFRAEVESRQRPSDPPLPQPAPDHARCAKAMRLFDGDGRIIRWPTRRNQQLLCLWVLWSRIPAREVFAERQVNDLMNRWHHFGDYALLRRELIGLGLMRRTPDGREYVRIEQKPPPELGVLLARLRERGAG